MFTDPAQANAAVFPLHGDALLRALDGFDGDNASATATEAYVVGLDGLHPRKNHDVHEGHTSQVNLPHSSSTIPFFLKSPIPQPNVERPGAPEWSARPLAFRPGEERRMRSFRHRSRRAARARGRARRRDRDGARRGGRGEDRHQEARSPREGADPREGGPLARRREAHRGRETRRGAPPGRERPGGVRPRPRTEGARGRERRLPTSWRTRRRARALEIAPRHELALSALAVALPRASTGSRTPSRSSMRTRGR